MQELDSVDVVDVCVDLGPSVDDSTEGSSLSFSVTGGRPENEGTGGQT